jgi:redox-sensing transcriptional repressor
MNDAQPSDGRVSSATSQRLSQYLRCMGGAVRAAGTVSSSELAERVGVSAAQVRRDLAALGHLGQRGVGYDVAELTEAIRKTLGIDRMWNVVVAGAGNLARALLRYRGFADQGFRIVGLFDTDPEKIGQVIEGMRVQDISELGRSVANLAAELGVVTVPSDAAQSVATQMAEAGLKGVMNFAPVLLRLPDHVRVVTVDLASHLEQLAFAVHFSALAERS